MRLRVAALLIQGFSMSDNAYGSAFSQNLEGAIEYFEGRISAGESGGKLDFSAADDARQAAIHAESMADGWFTSDAEEALAFWSDLDEWLKGWKGDMGARSYLSTCISGALSQIGKDNKQAAEVEYSTQVKEKVDEAAQKITDVIVETGKDPSGLWAAVGGGLGFALGTVVGGPVGGPVGAGLGGAAAGWVAGKAKAAGLL